MAKLSQYFEEQTKMSAEAIEATMESLSKELDMVTQVSTEASYLKSVVVLGNNEATALAMEHFGFEDNLTLASLEGVISDTLNKAWETIVKFFKSVSEWVKQKGNQITDAIKKLDYDQKKMEESQKDSDPNRLLFLKATHYLQFSAHQNLFKGFDKALSRDLIPLMRHFATETDPDKLEERLADYHDNSELYGLLGQFENNYTQLSKFLSEDRKNSAESFTTRDFKALAEALLNLMDYNELLMPGSEYSRLVDKLNSIKNSGKGEEEFLKMQRMLVTYTRQTVKPTMFMMKLHSVVSKIKELHS